MGMDVVGRTNPDAYFRNNVWWWRPLWEYCCDVYPPCGEVNGHFNDGDGLDETQAQELADKLKEELESGRTEEQERAFYAELAKLPRHKCDYCDGTGIRSDEVGVDAGMPTRILEPEMQVLLGRTHGWCNSCRGEGMCEDISTWYEFRVDNVREFVEFLEDSGGFSIY
jgi:hypothetical protein